MAAYPPLPSDVVNDAKVLVANITHGGECPADIDAFIDAALVTAGLPEGTYDERHYQIVHDELLQTILRHCPPGSPTTTVLPAPNGNGAPPANGGGVPTKIKYQWKPLEGPWLWVHMAAVGAGAYHGYKRNETVGGAILWAFLTGLAPVIAIPVALAQGFGKRK